MAAQMVVATAAMRVDPTAGMMGDLWAGKTVGNWADPRAAWTDVKLVAVTAVRTE